VLTQKKGAHVLVVSQLPSREINSWIKRAPSWLKLIFWDFARFMAIESMDRRGLKSEPIVFFKISIKFLIDRVPSYRILEFWGLGRIGSRPQARMTTRLKLEMILILRPFKGAVICPILIIGSQVMLENAYYFDKGVREVSTEIVMSSVHLSPISQPLLHLKSWNFQQGRLISSGQ
jgi:hypothetical protein